MRKKSKTLLLTIIAFCLSVACICFGVYAAQSASLKFNGNIGYTMHDPIVNITGEVTNGSTSQSFSRTVKCIEGEPVTTSIFSFDSLSFVQSGSAVSDLEFSLQLENLDTANDMFMQIELVSTLPTGVSVSTNATYVQIPYEDGCLNKGSSSTLKFGFSSTTATTLSNFSIKFTFRPTSELASYTFPTTWKSEIANTTSTAALSASTLSKTATPTSAGMTTALSASALTSIMFEKSAPAGYTKIGELSTGIRVYQSTTTSTDIAFVWAGTIYAPESCSALFGHQRDIYSLKTISFNNFITENTTNMAYMFARTSLTELDLSNFNTSNVDSMSYMFESCENLKKIDFSSFNTKNVTSMYRMFYECSALVSLELITFDTSKVNNMTSMFSYCSSLEVLDLRSFNMINVGDFGFFPMLSALSSLKTFYTPYNYKYDLVIGTGNTLYCNNEVVTFVPANTTQSLTFTNVAPAVVTFPTTWKEELANTNTNYVSSAISDTEITSIKFEKSAPANYTQIGSLSTGIHVYQDTTTSTGIAFVWGSTINAPSDCTQLFGTDTSDTATALQTITFNNFNTETATIMKKMFNHAESLSSLDLSNFNTVNVTNMCAMFQSCTIITTITFGSNFNTAKVTDMTGMFNYCEKLNSLDLTNFNTSEVTSLKAMFSFCTAITSLDLSSFNTSKVTDMSVMFQYCEELTAITFGSNFNTSIVTDMSYMFAFCKKIKSLDLSCFITLNVENMGHMFKQCSSLNTLNVSSFNTSKVTCIDAMFLSCTSLTELSLTNFVTTSLENNCASMFSRCTGLKKLDLSSFNFSNITNHTGTNSMLNFGSSSLIEELKTPYNNTMALTITTGSTLYNAETGSVVTSVPANTTKSLTYTNVAPATFDDTWKTQVASTSYMSTTVTPANLTSIAFEKSAPTGYSQIGTLSSGIKVYQNTNNTNQITFVHTNIIYAPESCYELFKDLTSLSSITFNNFNTSNTNNMYRLFMGCTSLTTINNLTNFNTANVENMEAMFANCKALTSVNLSSFNTANVTRMISMFQGCTALTSVNVSSFNTEKVKTMNAMFAQCSKLGSADLSSFKTTVCTDIGGMFNECSALSSVEMPNFSNEKLTASQWVFGNCTSLTSIDLSGFNTENITNMTCFFYNATSLRYLDLSNFNMKNVTSAESMLNLRTNTTITYIKTPYNNTIELAITTGKTFYYDGEIVSTVPSNTSSSLNYTTTVPSAVIFDSDWKTQISSLTYNGTTTQLTYSSLTMIDIDKTAKTNYTKIGKLTSGINVYKSVKRATDIMFVWAGTIKAPTNSKNLFNGLSALTSFALTNFNTKSAQYMNDMFTSCSNLSVLTFNSDFKTSSAIQLNGMFNGCKNLTYIDLSTFSSEALIETSHLFCNCSSLKSVAFPASFTINNVTTLWGFFQGCTSLTSVDISMFNTSKVTSMNQMFYNCSSLTKISLTNFNTSNVTNMYNMFYGCSALTSLDLSSFDMTKVTSYSNMLNFGSSNNIKEFLTPYNNTAELAITTGNVLYEFDESDTTKTVTSVPASTATSKVYFSEYVIFKSGWDTRISALIDSSSITSLTFDSVAPSSGYTKKTNFYTGLDIYYNTNDNSEIIFVSSKLIVAPANCSSYFLGLTSLKSITFNNFSTAAVTIMNSCFYNNPALTSLDLSSFITSNVTNMYAMFGNCSALTSLDLSSFNTANVTTMSSMFDKCSSLTSLDISNFNTENVTTMAYMFRNCSKLTSLDLSSFNTSNVTNMGYMFYNCSALTSLDLSNFNMTKVTAYYYMLNFGTNGNIYQLKTPYNNSYELTITNGHTLYYQSSAVTSVPAGITASRTYYPR